MENRVDVGMVSGVNSDSHDSQFESLFDDVGAKGAEFPSLNDAYKTGGPNSPTDATGPSVKANFRFLEADQASLDMGVSFSIPRRIVTEVNARFENTIYGYFIGKRLAFPVVDYFARQNWAKYGLCRVMLTDKGFFFFKFTSKKGVDDVLENGPWLIRRIPIVLKQWVANTRLDKEELARIPVWVKLHDVPLQVFSEDGLSMIASHIGKPLMLDAYTTTMCMESWGRSSFARCMIEIDAKDELKDSLTFGVPLDDDSGYTKETVSIEYEWKPLRCDQCKVFGHNHILCPKMVKDTPSNTESVPVHIDDDHVNNKFHEVTRNKKKGNKKKGGTNGGFPVGNKPLYVPKVNLPAVNASKHASIAANNPSTSKVGPTAQVAPNKAPKTANVPSTSKVGSSLIALTPLNDNRKTTIPTTSAEFPASFKSGFLSESSRKDGGVGTSNSFDVLNASDEEVVEDVVEQAANLFYVRRDKAKNKT